MKMEKVILTSASVYLGRQYTDSGRNGINFPITILMPDACSGHISLPPSFHPI